MNLNQYFTIKTDGESRIIRDEIGVPIATITRGQTGALMIGAICTAVLSAGGVVFDYDTAEYIVGSLDQLARKGR